MISSCRALASRRILVPTSDDLYPLVLAAAPDTVNKTMIPRDPSRPPTRESTAEGSGLPIPVNGVRRISCRRALILRKASRSLFCQCDLDAGSGRWSLKGGFVELRGAVVIRSAVCRVGKSLPSSRRIGIRSGLPTNLLASASLCCMPAGLWHRRVQLGAFRASCGIDKPR